MDTAAQGGLIGCAGKPAKKLKRHGLKVSPLQKTGKARSIGGQASVCGMSEVPLDIAGIIPISLLTALESITDLHGMNIEFPKVETEAPLHWLPTGHIAVDVCDFHQGTWKLPREALQHGRTEEMYREFKKVGFSWHGWTANHVKVYGKSCRSESRHDALQPHHQHEPRGIGGAQRASGAQWEASNSKLASNSARSMRSASARQQNRKWAAAGQLGGCSHGSSSSMAQVCKDGNVVSDKQAYYAQVIKTAPLLAKRKCKEVPRMKVEECPHPTAELKGGGSQYSREIWCGMCHQRWRAAAKQMEVVQKKTRQESVKENATTVSTPKEPPSVPCLCRMPAQRHL